MQELDKKHSSREEADVELNSNELQLNGRSMNNEGRHHAPSPLNIDVSTLIIPKYRGCEALDTLSSAKGENISTNECDERENEAKLSSSLRMFVSKEGSDEEEPEISIDRRSHSEGEDEVIAIEDDMEHATCGRQCKDWCEANLGTIFVSLVCSSIWIVVIVVIIIFAGWKVLLTILIILFCVLLIGFISGIFGGLVFYLSITKR